MFAVIGKKIVDKLNGNANFNAANDSGKSQELLNATFPLSDTSDWNWQDPPTEVTLSQSGFLLIQGGTDPADTGNPMVSTGFTVSKDKEYLVRVTYNAPYYPIRFKIGTTVYGNDVYDGEYLPKTTLTGYQDFNFTFKADISTSIDQFYLNAELDKSLVGGFRNFIISSASVKEVGDKKVFPVIIPQEVDYPATTYEIMNVSNFMAKSSSLDSCDVTIRISCFADSYTTTYNQAKAVVEALDLYQVTYTEDGQSYTAKFRFINLDDEYYKNAEKFYKNITFDCLIIKN